MQVDKKYDKLFICVIVTHIKCNDNRTTHTCVCAVYIHRVKQEKENETREAQRGLDKKQ